MNASPMTPCRPALGVGLTGEKYKGQRGRLTLRRQLLLQLLTLLVLFTVLFPILWIFSLSLDPRNRSRPDGLNLIPPARRSRRTSQVIAQPTSNPICFLELALNSLEDRARARRSSAW